MIVNIFYMRPRYFRDLSLGDVPPKLGELHITHAYLKTIEVACVEDAFARMQGEVWSPNGEARDLIEACGLSHTSMSVGDVVQDVDAKQYYVCASVGFTQLVAECK